MTKRNHSAAARKAQRTRKRMKAAREQMIATLREQHQRDIESGLVSPEKIGLDDPGFLRQLHVFAELMRDYKTLLPCPDFSGNKKAALRRG